jgi:formamidopyrimidine-DNA glycosylase
MPELPEVETVRRGLEAGVVGRTAVSVSATGARTVRRQGATELQLRLTGRRFEAARRRGKYLALLLDEGGALVVHLRMSGQLLLVADASLPLVPHTHVVIGLDDGSELRFVDPRTFGEVYVAGDLGPGGLPVELERLGVDPVADGLPPARLGRALSGRRLPVKAALMDQRLVAGIGNIYADEICFRARVRPDRRCDTLTPPAVRRLAEATVEVLEEAVAARGSTLADARYRDLMGEAGEFQHSHAVYGRADQPCPRCGRPVTRTKVGGRSSFYCGRCQR